MKTAAVIAEYNPFHRGHAYQLEQLRDEYGVTHTAAVMSTSVTQRGEPALCDMFVRAHAAVLGGADAVFALPYVYSAQTAEIFAGGGVRLADSIGADILAFGCEDCEPELFSRTAEILIDEPDEYRAHLKYCLDQGLSFAVSRQKALEAVLNCSLELIRRPNNILAVEYIKALKLINSSVRPVLIKRHMAGHASSSVSGGYAGSSHIRRMILSGNEQKITECFPEHEAVRELVLNAEKNDIERYNYVIKAFIKMSTDEQIRQTAYYEQGLENRMREYAGLLNNGTECYIQAVSSSRYTKNRIRRLIMNLILGYSAEDLEFFRQYTPGFVRLLAADEKGRELVNFIKQNSRISVISNMLKEDGQMNVHDRRTADFDSKAYDFYHLHADAKDDRKIHPVII